jgi:hypothetical protein
MSAFKQFLASDIIITPFEVNKSFTFKGNELEESNVTINRFLGQNIGGLFNPSTDPTTGYDNSQYQRLIYNSIKELYYSNYLSSSYGDNINTGYVIPGSQPDGDVLVGTTQSDGRYFNYPQTTLTFEKYFPTGSNDIIGVISIPSRLFGNYIQPNSFYFKASSGSIIDDGEGNVILTSTNEICGNIFYDQGLITLTSDSNPKEDGYGVGKYGAAIYGLSDSTFIENFITDSNVTCSFTSSLDIFETQYKSTIRENEFNFSLNPSLISGSTDGTTYGFVTESYFSPYVTTVGLYDENQNLLAVGKLSQPLPTSPTTDTTILINIDR